MELAISADADVFCEPDTNVAASGASLTGIYRVAAQGCAEWQLRAVMLIVAQQET
jgi:hypothetical protein